VGEECSKTDLDASAAKSLHLVAAIIQLEVMVATWKVARLLEILPGIMGVRLL
jgi:hypothetical protein